MVTGLFARPGELELPGAVEEDSGQLLPERANRAYDVRLVVCTLLDDDGVELHHKWAPHIVTTLGRLAGRTIGVIADNPLRLDGCFDSTSAEKADRFARMCDSLGVPLLVVADVPDYLPGLNQEWHGVGAVARDCCTPSPRPSPQE